MKTKLTLIALLFVVACSAQKPDAYSKRIVDSLNAIIKVNDAQITQLLIYQAVLQTQLKNCKDLTADTLTIVLKGSTLTTTVKKNYNDLSVTLKQNTGVVKLDKVGDDIELKVDSDCGEETYSTNF